MEFLYRNLILLQILIIYSKNNKTILDKIYQKSSNKFKYFFLIVIYFADFFLFIFSVAVSPQIVQQKLASLPSEHFPLKHMSMCSISRRPFHVIHLILCQDFRNRNLSKVWIKKLLDDFLGYLICLVSKKIVTHFYESSPYSFHFNYCWVE